MTSGLTETLYGDRAGRWVLTVSPPNVVTPPWVEVGVPFEGVRCLSYLGSPAEVVARVYAVLPSGRGRGRQQLIATRLGVLQQHVSRYVAGHRVPVAKLPALVALYFEVFDDAPRPVPIKASLISDSVAAC